MEQRQGVGLPALSKILQVAGNHMMIINIKCSKKALA